MPSVKQPFLLSPSWGHSQAGCITGAIKRLPADTPWP